MGNELKKRIADLEAENLTLRVGPMLDSEIAAAGVKPEFRRAVRALFLSRHQFEIDGADVFCSGELLGSVMRKFAASPEGQNFLGSDPTSKSDRRAPTSKKRSEMTPAEKAAYTAKHGLAAFEALPR